MAGDREKAVEIFSAKSIHADFIKDEDGNTIFRLGNEVCELGDNVNLKLSTGTGTTIGEATTQKLSFWNAAPVVQPSAIADPASDTAANNAAIDSILAALRTMGLIAT